MASLSGFRRPDDEHRFAELSEQILDRWWPPLPRQDLTVETSFGTTALRRIEGGEGTPIMMLHPTMGSGVGLYPFIGPLAKARTVFVPDTIGTPGRSVQTAALEDRRDVARWLDETIDGLGLDAVHLVGYSEGGFVACVNAALTSRPDRVASLTLIEPGGVIGKVRPSMLLAMVVGGLRMMLARDKRAAMRPFNRWFNGGTYELPDEVLDLVLLGTTGFRQRIPMPRPLPDDELARIMAPTLIMLAEKSKLHDVDAIATRARELMANATVSITPEVGHGFAYDDPDAAMATVVSFVESHERR